MLLIVYFYHKIIDKNNLRKCITELKYIDSTKIKKVREVQRDKDQRTGVDVVKKVEEYFIYNEKGLGAAGTGSSNQGIKMAPDSIAYVPSGFVDGNSGRVLSYLHKAINPVNQLRMIEDALVI